MKSRYLRLHDLQGIAPKMTPSRIYGLSMGGKLKQEIICQGLKIAIGRVKILAKKPCE
jgi:hypothetical protein